ncbi:MoaD/ThiS family protein [Wohlfahrtiimonas chitiniclastica]|uniref:MoaD/ThiS family protein n=1 Tax=Wohlfahrtiimonas chitiniclastica TaxID=400946 RepID=UPI001BCADC1F|nr:MoaD/ThiS family protein [Wohlfahrtiimonas chitiniclastica]MBS7820700.1 MoaD/ThiS family protein [Wohlfahrtiimonas chitiniclastica]
MITIQYFGVLKDRLGVTEESIEWANGDTDALLNVLRARSDEWQAALAPERVFRVVVNDEIIYQAINIQSGDRVAILPPVTGG